MDPEDRHLRGNSFFMYRQLFFTCAFHGPPSGIQVSLTFAISNGCCGNILCLALCGKEDHNPASYSQQLSTCIRRKGCSVHLRGSAGSSHHEWSARGSLKVADPSYRNLSPRVTRVGGEPVNNSDHFGITRHQVRRAKVGEEPRFGGRRLWISGPAEQHHRHARHARSVVPRVIARQPCGSPFFRCQYLIWNFVHPTAGPCQQGTPQPSRWNSGFTASLPKIHAETAGV